jgi:hypothetical protein
MILQRDLIVKRFRSENLGLNIYRAYNKGVLQASQSDAGFFDYAIVYSSPGDRISGMSLQLGVPTLSDNDINDPNTFIIHITGTQMEKEQREALQKEQQEISQRMNERRSNGFIDPKDFRRYNEITSLLITDGESADFFWKAGKFRQSHRVTNFSRNR